jgi:hypothetical protein
MTDLFKQLNGLSAKLNAGGPLDRVRHTGILLHAAIFAQDGQNKNLATEAHGSARTIAMSASVGEA